MLPPDQLRGLALQVHASTVAGQIGAEILESQFKIDGLLAELLHQ